MHRRGLAVLVGLAVIAGGAVGLGAAAKPAVGATHRVDEGRYIVYQAHQFRTFRFKSADGNVSCEIYETTTTTPWSCAARRHAWAVPRLPKDDRLQAAGRDAITASDIGGPFVLRSFNDPASAVRDGTQYPTKVLPAGSRISVDGISCSMSRAARVFTVSCSTERGARFVMSRTTLRLVAGRN